MLGGVHMTPAIRIRPLGRDLRSPSLRAAGAALAQEQADLLVLREFNRRVRTNPKEVARLRRGMT